MDVNELRRYGADMLDFIATYLETIGDRPPLHSVTPGYLRQLIPDQAPTTPERWQDVLNDIERVIMPGMTHWQSPNFYAYFPSGFSVYSLLADMLTDGLNCIGFSWNSSPACTELEVSMMDWLAKVLNLPSQFLFSEGPGGGVIQASASDATAMAVLSARTVAANKLRETNPDITQGQIIDKLVAYTSQMSHSSSERAGLIAFVTMRKLPTDDQGSMQASTLEAAVKEDLAKGLVPFFCCATVGTTSICSFDNLEEIGPVCNAYDIWLHADAAYAGSACICPEFRHLINGVEHCTTFNFNPHKWMNINFDCSTMWVKNKSLLSGAFVMDPLYLKHNHQHDAQAMPDFRHWHISLGRKFRSLKLWFVMRMHGVEGLQNKIRKDVGLAKQFERHVRGDDRFEIVGTVTLGLVCFRLKSSNQVNEELHDRINQDRRLHLVPATFQDRYTLRLAVGSNFTQPSHIDYAWTVVHELTNALTAHNK